MDSNAVHRKALFVCEEQRLRSPTAEQIYSENPELDVRSAGLGKNAKIPVTLELLEWADVIFVMARPQRNRIRKKFPNMYAQKEIICLYVPDEYDYMDPILIHKLTQKLSPYLGAPTRDR